MPDYEQSLIRDVRYITGIEVHIEVRPYNKNYYGGYYPYTDTVVVYLRPDKGSPPYSYRTLLETALHEAVHCMQWRDPLFKRVKGVMHNPDFYKKLNYFLSFVDEVLDEKCV